jgi:hypothetical protein
MTDPAIDVRFFARPIRFVILCAFLWLLAFELSGQRWVFPVAFVGLCVYALCQVRAFPVRKFAFGLADTWFSVDRG